MADDLQGLDSSPIMRIPVNYANDISGQMNVFRDILQFKGTTQEIINYATIYPKVYDLEFLFCNKEEKYNFLTFWHLLQGENKKFWYITEERAFELFSAIGSLDTSFVVDANNFIEIFQGHERVCFRFRDGDLLTRRISDVTENPIDNTYTLETGTTFDRVIQLTDIYGIYFIVPARFDNEVARITNESGHVHTTNLRVQEILTEYPA